MNENVRLRFEERQPFRANPAVWLVVPGTLLIWVMTFVQLVLGTPVGTRPASDGWLLTLWLLFGVLFPTGLLGSVLHVRVTDRELQIRFWPFVRRAIALEQVRRAERRNGVDPLSEFGGWGVRWHPRNGKAYLTDGADGVQLELDDGQRLFVGSTRAADLHAALSGPSGS